MVVLTLSPLGDLTRFRRKNFNDKAFLCTAGKKLRCSGVLLAARSAPIEEILERKQKISARELSDDLPGLETCLDLVYGGSVRIGLWNYKTIYKFGAIYKINEMMDGILSWISTELDYTDFWGAYLELKKVHVDPIVFKDTIKKYLCNYNEGFMQYTIQLCQDHNADKFTAIVNLLGEVLDKNILNIILDVANKAADNQEAPSSSRLPAGDSKYLQTVVSSTVCYIDKYSKSDLVDDSDIIRSINALENISEICTDVKICRSITSVINSITSKTFHPTEAAIIHSTTDLNWELINALTSRSTSYDTIRNFTERNEQVLHPCITAEIVLKWWSVNKDRETGDMGFVTPLFTKVDSIGSWWYCNVINDSRYEGLTRALGVTQPTLTRYIYYHSGGITQLRTTLQQYIRTGGSTVHLPKEWLHYSDNMREYVDSLPVFRYSADTVPSYGAISGHWYIYKPSIPGRHVSLITTTQQELLSVLDNEDWVTLDFVPNIAQ